MDPGNPLLDILATQGTRPNHWISLIDGSPLCAGRKMILDGDRPSKTERAFTVEWKKLLRSRRRGSRHYQTWFFFIKRKSSTSVCMYVAARGCRARTTSLVRKTQTLFLLNAKHWRKEWQASCFPSCPLFQDCELMIHFIRSLFTIGFPSPKKDAALFIKPIPRLVSFALLLSLSLFTCPPFCYPLQDNGGTFLLIYRFLFVSS